MEQFKQFTNGKGLFIGVDFGHGNDFAVETQMQKLPNGSIEIISINIIGRTSEMSEVNKQKICEEYERFCNQKAVE